MSVSFHGPTVFDFQQAKSDCIGKAKYVSYLQHQHFLQLQSLNLFDAAICKYLRPKGIQL